MRLGKITAMVILGVGLLKTSGVFAYPAQICNDTICQPVTYFRQDQVVAKLTEMLKNSPDQMVLCAADPEQKKCMDRPLTFSGQTNLMRVDFQIPFMRIFQKERLSNSFGLVLDYLVKANDKYPACTASVSQLGIFPKGEVRITSPSFTCQATELGKTSLALQFQIDYINFDTGWLGATYYASSSGDVVGEGSGYVMIQLSSERSIQLERIQPYDPRKAQESVIHDANVDKELKEWYPNGMRSDYRQGKLVDWDWDNIKTEWDSFAEKALKIIYLEPLDD